MKTPWVEVLLGWASLGFLVIWILEMQRVSFVDSYWLMMLCLSCLLGFLYLRRRRNATPVLSKYVPEEKKKKGKMRGDGAGRAEVRSKK